MDMIAVLQGLEDYFADVSISHALVIDYSQLMGTP